MTLERDSERGQQAQAVLANPIYSDSFALVEQEITRQWRDARDRESREELHRLLLSLTKARQVLEGVMRSGKLAAADLERKRTLADRLGLRRNAA